MLEKVVYISYPHRQPSSETEIAAHMESWSCTKSIDQRSHARHGKSKGKRCRISFLRFMGGPPTGQITGISIFIFDITCGERSI